jgi:hypothetical protein
MPLSPTQQMKKEAKYLSDLQKASDQLHAKQAALDKKKKTLLYKIKHAFKKSN